MIKIDFKQFIRDRIWFGCQCIAIMHTLNGEKASWTWSQFWYRRSRPCIRITWQVDEYIQNPDGSYAQL